MNKRQPTIGDFYNDLVEHQHEDKLQFELIHTKLDEMKRTMPTREDIEHVMMQSIKQTFKSSYGGLLVIAAIVGALAIIGGGAKWILGVIGFSFLKS